MPECRYGRKCYRPDCYFTHPHGRELDGSRGPAPAPAASTVFVSPPPTAASPGGPAPAAARGRRACRYGRSCHRADCHFAHPDGRDMDEGGGGGGGPSANPGLQNAQEHWFPASRDCGCCGGYVYQCSAPMCASFGKCACAVTEGDAESTPEMLEDELKREFVPSQFECTCCKGYVYACTDPTCMILGICACFVEAQQPAASSDPPPQSPSRPLTEDEKRDHWVPDSRQCVCCNGFVYACRDEGCVAQGVCKCMAEADASKPGK